MAAAATRVVPVYIDCTDRNNPPEITKKYGVSGYPTVVYTDPEGKKLKDVRGKSDAAAYIGAIDNVAKKLPGRPSMWSNTVKSALAAAKTGKKLVAVYVAKPDADPLKVTAGLMKNLGDRKTKLVWTYDSGTEAALKRYEVESAPAVVVYEPGEKEGERKLLGKVTITKGDDPKLVNQAIDDILAGAKK